MKKRINYVMACLLVGIFGLICTVNVKAEKVFSEELTQLFGFGETQCYVCGETTEDGVVQLKSDTTSLEEGEIVDVQVLYNSSQADHPFLSGLTLEMFYNTEVLEYMDYTFLKTGISVLRFQEDNYPEDTLAPYKIDQIVLNCGDYRGEGGLISFRYKIKKRVDSISIHCMPTAVVKQSELAPSTVKYFEEDGENMADVLCMNITDSPKASSSLTLSTTPVQGSEEVTVPINIEKNDGFNLLGLSLDYDTSLFIYESLEIADSLKSKISLDSIYEASGSGRIKASFIALEDITDVGDFLKLKLKVKDGVAAGTSSSIEVGISQIGNKAEISMSGSGTSCAVSITDAGGEEQPTLGDVNADKKIDLVDAVYILQNYNQVREFTKAQETAADVDKNGTVNLVDALMIMKYFNGEIAEF